MRVCKAKKKKNRPKSLSSVGHISSTDNPYVLVSVRTGRAPVCDCGAECGRSSAVVPVCAKAWLQGAGKVWLP